MNGNCFCNLLPRFLLSGMFIFSLVFGGFSSVVRADGYNYWNLPRTYTEDQINQKLELSRLSSAQNSDTLPSKLDGQLKDATPPNYANSPGTIDAGADTAGSSAASAAPGACDTPEGARMCAANSGLDDGAKAIKAAADKIQAAVVQAETFGGRVMNKNKIKELVSEASSYQSHYGKCVTTQNAASKWCVEKSSPHLQEGLNIVNTLASGLTGMAVKDSCSTISKMMQAGQGVLTLYTASCSATRAACEASCSFVLSSLKRIMQLNNPANLAECSEFGSPISPTAAAACTKFVTSVNLISSEIAIKARLDSDSSNDQSTAMKDKACTYGYGMMLASAGAGIMSMVKTFSQSSNCDKKSDGTGGQPTALAADKCKIPGNANTPECICLASPRTPGCANSLDKAGQNVNPGYLAQSSPDSNLGLNKKDLTNLDLGGGNAARDPANTNPNSGSAGGNGPPVGGGGGAGLSGSGGGAGGGADKAGADGEKKGLNANIFGGGSGGGGGGGWGRDFGGGADKSGLRSYLPGGAKDPLKMSGQQNWNKEVTGQAGKSNFEKVRDRYRDNNGSLLNN